MAKENPLISIITVVYNGGSLLEGTIQSVVNQSYTNIEYIIVDGASSDGTVDIIKKYNSQISKWISESDKGLYDAMNKALDLATGDFIWFINAGDRIFEPNTLEKLIEQYEPRVDVLAGEVMLVNETRDQLGTRSELTTQKLPKQLTWKSLSKGMVVCHQGFIPARHLAPKYMESNLSADIDWVIKILKKAHRVVNTRLVIAEYLVGGVSKQSHKQSLRDRYNILKTHFGFLPNIINHLMIIVRGILHKLTSGKKGY